MIVSEKFGIEYSEDISIHLGKLIDKMFNVPITFYNVNDCDGVTNILYEALLYRKGQCKEEGEIGRKWGCCIKLPTDGDFEAVFNTGLEFFIRNIVLPVLMYGYEHKEYLHEEGKLYYCINGDLYR
jgi:hypothetical protein